MFWYIFITQSCRVPRTLLAILTTKTFLLTSRRICVDASAFKSVQRFEEEIVKRLPCVGIFEWRGVIKTNPKRTHFDIESKVERLLSFHDMGAFFSAKLLRVARDFIAQHLTSNFISVHIRTAEKFYVLEEIFPQSRGVFLDWGRDVRERFVRTFLIFILRCTI